MVEVAEAGDRVLYAAHLFRSGKAPRVVCTSGTVAPGAVDRPEASFMSELLEDLGVPQRAIVRETAYRELLNLLPTPGSYMQFSETMHEYLGLAWYRLRGWI